MDIRNKKILTQLDIKKLNEKSNWYKIDKIVEEGKCTVTRIRTLNDNRVTYHYFEEDILEFMVADQKLPVDVSDSASFVSAITNGGPVNVTADIDLDVPAIVTEDTTVYLNGHNITAPLFTESGGEVLPGNTDSYVFWVKENGKLTINGEGEIRAKEANYSMAVWAQGKEASVTINGGNFYNGGDACDLVYASAGASVEINGGYFHAAGPQSGTVPGTKNMHSALNLKDNTGSSIIVRGGSFYGFNPANNVSEGPNTNFVADGYMVVSEGMLYTVVSDDQEVIVNDADAVVTAMAKAKKIILGKDIIMNDGVRIAIEGAGRVCELDLNGKTLVFGGHKTEATGKEQGVLVRNGAKLTINATNGGKIMNDPTVEAPIMSYNKATLIINGGNFVSENSNCVCVWDSYCQITGGSFKAIQLEDGRYNTVNMKDNSGADVTIMGGAFYMFNPGETYTEPDQPHSFLAPGYGVYREGEYYIVLPENEIAKMQ